MAIKVVEAKDKRFLKKLYHECELLKTLNHPNIVNYFGCVMDEEKSEASIFMELMPHSLVSSYRQFGPMNENILRKHTKQILSALCYLHSHEKRIIHGDLKAANILFDGRQIKLTDFGDSRILGKKIPNLSVSHSGV
jgi:serine/threonine protein kinase